MKFLLSFFLSISLTVGFAQDTLKEVFTPMYSRYYVVHANNHQFEYYFHHCTGIVYVKGVLKKRWFNWKFYFDSITPPITQYECASEEKSDSLKISFRNSIDSMPEFWFNVSINQMMVLWVDTSGITVPKSTDNNYSIGFYNDENNFSIRSLDCSELLVYVPNTFWTYHSSGLEKLKKRGNRFYTTEIVWYENEDDPYGRKVKRKIKAGYGFN